MSRIVVKIGSNVLTRADGKPNVTNMSAIVDQVAHLKNAGHEIILISSGAVACRRRHKPGLLWGHQAHRGEDGGACRPGRAGGERYRPGAGDHLRRGYHLLPPGAPE